nr:unnamed protein product [Callosobruchus chinensis]
MSLLQEVTLDELTKRHPEQDEDQIIFNTIVNLIDDNYPTGWREWKVIDISYQDLFGDNIQPKVENKVRLALPTKELIHIFNPDNKLPSEKSFKKMRRKLLTWPLTRSLLFAPQNIRDQIHVNDIEKFLQAVKLLKPRISSRTATVNERSITPSTPRAASTPKRTNSVESRYSDEEEPPRKRPNKKLTSSSPNSEDLLKALERQNELFQALMGQINQPRSTIPDTRLSEPPHSQEKEPSSSTDNSFSVEEHTPEPSLSWKAPSLLGEANRNNAFGENQEMDNLRLQICDAQRKLAALQSSANQFEIEFEPATKEAEPSIPKADPKTAELGVKCQRLNTSNWNKLRYGEVQKQLHAAPVFTPLKINPQLVAVTPSWCSSEHLVKADYTLGTITHGLLLQRREFEKGINQILSALPSPELHEGIRKYLSSSDAKFRQISDQLLQYTCGRRSEVLETRRKLYRIPGGFLSNSLHSIPPSETHLFAENELNETLKSCGGFYKFFPSKKDRPQAFNTQTSNYNGKSRPERQAKSFSRPRSQQGAQKKHFNATRRTARKDQYKRDSRGTHQPSKKL